MIILFIRHARAVPASEYRGEDLQRPLKKKGVIRAKKVFRGLKILHPRIDLIVTSEALRSRQTAEILEDVYPESPRETVKLLNPGADYGEFLRFLHELGGDIGVLAIIGHEPDLSECITGLLQLQGRPPGPEEPVSLPLDFRKAACAELERGSDGAWELKAFLPPRVLRRLGR